MPETRRNHRISLILGAVIVTVLIASLGSFSAFRKVASFQPLGFEAQRAAGSWLITEVGDAQPSLLVGDQLVLIGGASPSNPAEMASRLKAEKTTTLAVLRGEQLINVEYQRPGIRLDYPYLALAATALLYLALGLYVLFQGPARPAGLFFLWCAASATVYLFTYVPSSPDPLTRGIFAVEELARIFLPALTLHLFLVFPKPVLTGRARRLVSFVYLPSAALATLQADLMFNQGAIFFGRVSRTSIRGMDRLEVGLLVAFSLLALGVLVYQLAHNQHWQQKRQLQWIAAGLGAGYLPFLLLYVVPWALDLRWPTWTTLAAVVPLSLVPLAFAWAIFRFRLWDVEVLLRQAASYAVTSILGVVSFSLVHLGLSRGIPDESLLTRNLLTFAAGLLIAGVLVPTERGVRSSLERLQSGTAFKRRRALAGLGRELLEERDLPVLAQRLTEQLREGLELERVDLLVEHENMLTPLGRDYGLRPIDRQRLAPEIWSRRWHRLTSATLPTAPSSAIEELHRAGFRYLFPLTLQGRPIGLLVTGLKLDGQPLNSEEMVLVRSLLDQTALALENAQLMEALRQQLVEVSQLKQHSEQILDSSPAGIAVIRRDGIVDNVNDAFCRITGGSRSETVGRLLHEVLAIAVLPKPGEPLREVTLHDAKGRERFLQVSSAPYDERGQLEVLVVVDVTEKVEMEHTLKEQERLASLGMLAAGVAHEVNTPITGISSYAQMLLADTPVGDPRRELLEKVERQTFRASRIVNNLLEFSRNRKQDQRVQRLDRVIDEAIDILDDKLDRSAVILRKNFPESPVTVLGGEGELQQVVTNLISNAIDAIGSREGRVVLTVEEDLQQSRARILVEDDGPGMAEDELERIFQPFYSTKLTSGGTGLGLSISYQIVRRHGGHLTAISTPNVGSCFTVDLPLYRDAAGATP
ncbi:MAG: PAS domain S-box protein [Thermoanaerobaculia bacterium]|nr:PAS domain S-box protein [Thermoanaerobaculia bacterium]